MTASTGSPAAKASDSRLLEIEAGLFYLAKWGVMGGGALLAVSLLALALGSRAYLRALFILGQIGVVVLAGGDPHPAFRFFLPILPLMALDLAWIIDRRARLIPGLALCLMALVLTRQSLPVLENASREGVARGGYVLS